MTMVAQLKDANGHVLGSVPVDPSKGDINAQVQAAMQQMQQNGSIPMNQRHSPQRTGIVQNSPNQYAQATVRLKFVQRGPNGQPQWAEMVVPCPPGCQPGTYVFVSQQ